MKKSCDYRKLVEDLNALLADLPDKPAKPDGYSTHLMRRLRKDVSLAMDRLEKLSGVLDEIKQPQFLFDPADPHNIGELIATTLRAQPKLPLATLEKFWGAGVYAIYYNGDFDSYGPIKNTNHPIYVGKADPEDAHANSAESQGPKLAARLIEHAKNIGKAENLRLADFEYRYLVVKSAYQKAAEDHLIKVYKPVWNNETGICYGLGKHGDSAKTRANERSPWDMLHPGRKWAAGNKPNRKSIEEIKRDITEHFRLNKPVTD